MAVTNAVGTTVSAPAVLTETTGKITDRLLSHFEFDESSGKTAPNSLGGADAELQNYASDTEQWIPGQIGGSLGFDGTENWVLVPSFVKPVGTMSLSLWVQSERELGLDESPELVRNWAGGGNGQFRIGLTDGAVGAQIAVGPNNPNAGQGEGMELPMQEWQHLAFTANGVELTVYRNGQPVSATAYLGDINAGNIDALGLGVALEILDGELVPTADGLFWEGQIDDLGIWGRPLSADFVSSL